MPDNRKPLIYGAFPVCRNYTVRAHICNLIAEKRCGRADAFRNAGTFQCGIHPQHLRPLDTRHETERGRRDRKHHPQRDLTPKPKRRLQVAAAVKIFGKRLKNSIFVLFCQINLNKSTAFSRPFGSNLGHNLGQGSRANSESFLPEWTWIITRSLSIVKS